MEILFAIIFLLVISFPFIQDIILYNQWKNDSKIYDNNLEFLDEMEVKKVHQITGYSVLKEWELEWDKDWKEENDYFKQKDQIWNGKTTTDTLLWN